MKLIYNINIMFFWLVFVLNRYYFNMLQYGFRKFMFFDYLSRNYLIKIGGCVFMLDFVFYFF